MPSYHSFLKKHPSDKCKGLLQWQAHPQSARFILHGGCTSHVIWKKKMCQCKTQWGSRVHQQYKPGGVEYHLWSGAYSISGMSSMSSEKHSTWQVFLKQQRQLNEAQVAQDIVVYMGPLSQGCGKWSQIPQALFLQKMLYKTEKASNASWFVVLSWSQVHLKKKKKCPQNLSSNPGEMY